MKMLFTVLIVCSLPVIAEPVDINQSDAETISQALNGIGPKKAEAIVKYRTEHGAFKSLDELEKVSGIGAKTIKINEKDILLSGGSLVGEAKSESKSEDQGKKTSKN